jgi:hypothetical protein
MWRKFFRKINRRMPSYKLIFYILFCIFVGLSVTVQLMKSDRVVSGVAYLILALLIFVFFGLRWFGREGKGVAGQWPPIINACPDYLTKYNRRESDGKVTPVCIDTVGVSRNCQLKKWPIDGTVPTDQAYYFTLDGSMEQKCARAKQMGLSWEVCDTFSPSGVPPDQPSGSNCVPA